MMKRTLILFVGAMAFTFCAGATEFKLKHDKSGAEYGPFSSDNGSVVALGSQTFTVVSDEGSGGGLHKIKMEVFNPANAPLGDALKMLELYSKLHDPAKKGITFTCDAPAAGKPEPRITADARNVSLMDGLSFIALSAGYTYKISATGVHLSPAK